MSVSKIELNEETLRNAVIKQMDNGNISDAFMFYNKLENEYPSEDNILLKSEMYSSIGEFDNANNELIKLYADTSDEDYLKQVFDNLHDKGDLASLVRYLGVFPNFDYLDFVFQYASEVEGYKPQQIKVVYPINDVDAVEIIEMARRENRNGNYALSNKIIDKHSLTHTVIYENAIYIKLDNYINLRDYNGLLDYINTLDKTFEKTASLVSAFAYCMMAKYDKANEYLTKYIDILNNDNSEQVYMQVKLNEEFVDLISKTLIDSEYAEEKYIFLEKLFDEFKLNNKFTYLNLTIKYLLGKKLEAYKLLSYITNIYGENCFSYVIKSMFDQNISVKTLDSFNFYINNFVIQNILNLEKIVNSGDITLARELLVNDKQTNMVVKYILTGVVAKNYNKLSDILFVIYNKDIGKFIREILINNFVLDEAKEPLLKIMIDKEADKNIDLVISGVYMKVDFTYPLDHIENEVYNGYYNMLLVALQKSYRLQEDLYTIQKNLKYIDKQIKEKNIDITGIDRNIVAMLLYNNIKGIMIDPKSMFEYFGVDINRYDKFRTLIYGSERQ